MEAHQFLGDKGPLDKVKDWLEEAHKTGLREPNAMLLATIDPRAGVSARVVLLKEIRPEGLVFYTNYQSPKGEQMALDPHVALTFYWDTLQRQIRIQGSVEKLSTEESEAYWQSRPRASQISQFISQQSKPLKDREKLQQAYDQAEKDLNGKPVPRPAHWGGYLVQPVSFEFWIGYPHRLHDRYYFTRASASAPWIGQRLYP